MENLRNWGKKLLKWGLIGLAIIFGLKLLFGGDVSKTSTSATDSGRKYADHHNWSKDPRDFFVEEVTIPDGSKGWVSIAAPPYYRVETSRTFEIEYDLGDGRTVKEGPSLPRQEVGNFPSTFDVHATGKGGTLKIWFHRNPTQQPVKKAVALKSARHAKYQQRFVKMHTRSEDQATSVQMM